MGQVLGKVLLTSRKDEPTIYGDFRISGLLRFQVTNTLSLVTGLPGPVTRFASYYSTRSIGDQLFGHCLSESSSSPGPVLTSNTSV